MKNWLKIIFTMILVLVVDLTTKHFLSDIVYFNLIPGVISIATNYGNPGAAFGWLAGNTVLLVIISLALIIGLLVFNHFVKNKSNFYLIGFGFVMGGAIGNLIDRIMPPHLVRDFIFLDFFPQFPIFNFADTFLCIGAVMLAIFIIFMAGKKNEK